MFQELLLTSFHGTYFIGKFSVSVVWNVSSGVLKNLWSSSTKMHTYWWVTVYFRPLSKYVSNYFELILNYPFHYYSVLCMERTFVYQRRMHLCLLWEILLGMNCIYLWYCAKQIWALNKFVPLIMFALYIMEMIMMRLSHFFRVVVVDKVTDFLLLIGKLFVVGVVGMYKILFIFSLILHYTVKIDQTLNNNI